MQQIFGSIIPAPNATGDLHMGHVLNLTIQDVFCRWQSLKGAKVYWAGSLDHGTTSTEFVVDRRVRERGEDPTNWTKQNWISAVDEWIAYITPRIYKQLHRMNLVMDMDEVRSMGDPFQRQKCQELLNELEKAKLLYRALTVVSWCPRRRTFVDKAETSMEPCQIKEYLVRYVDEADPKQVIDIWIENPETLLNDAALAVSSQHALARSSSRFVMNPIGIRIPVVTDNEFLKGSSSKVARITPGHCARSFRWAVKNRFPISRAYGENNVMEAAEYKGRARVDAAREILAKASANKRLRITHTIEVRRPVFRLSNGPVEELLTEQCFLETEKMAAAALKLLRDGEVRVHPRVYHKGLEMQLEAIVSAKREGAYDDFADDWCISQQTAWGNDLPISHLPWRAPAGSEHIKPMPTDHVATLKLADALFAHYVNEIYSLSPEKHQEIAKASICVTGLDLLLYWIEPIIMLATVLDRGLPFRNVVIHPLVCDAEGRKMSKSLGNVIVPDDMWERYGPDATRLALLRSADLQKSQMNFDENQVQESRQLLDKAAERLEIMRQRVEALRGRFTPSREICEHDLFLEIDRAMEQFDLKLTLECVDRILQLIAQGDSSSLQDCEELLSLASLLEPFAPEMIVNLGLSQSHATIDA